MGPAAELNLSPAPASHSYSPQLGLEEEGGQVDPIEV